MSDKSLDVASHRCKQDLQFCSGFRSVSRFSDTVFAYNFADQGFGSGSGAAFFSVIRIVHVIVMTLRTNI